MRIQQTDQILKEAKSARHATRTHEAEMGMFAKMKRAILHLFGKN